MILALVDLRPRGEPYTLAPELTAALLRAADVPEGGGGDSALLVDLAPGSVSHPASEHGPRYTGSSVLLDGVPLGSAVRTSVCPGVWVLPGDEDLGERLTLLRPYSGDHQLAYVLDSARDRYRIVLISGAPPEGALRRQAMLAADAFVLVAPAGRSHRGALLREVGRSREATRTAGHAPLLAVVTTDGESLAAGGLDPVVPVIPWRESEGGGLTRLASEILEVARGEGLVRGRSSGASRTLGPGCSGARRRLASPPSLTAEPDAEDPVRLCLPRAPLIMTRGTR